MNAAILFEPDAYLMTGPRLMGRHSAGDGFLRAAVKALQGEPLHGYTAYPGSAAAIERRVKELDPRARTVWIQADRLGALGALGVLFRPDNAIHIHTRSRLRVGSDRYSICGVTHTLSGSLELVGDTLVSPAMPWDAIICTSSVAVTLMQEQFAADRDYLRWRFGSQVTAPQPQLPLIPLGVHSEDFEYSADVRAVAREALALAEDEVAVLFAGRLTFLAKAHPYQMYRALQAVAETTGRKIVLIQAGQFPDPNSPPDYARAMAAFCPDVRSILVDGKDAERYRQAWRAADLFISLSDNVQETFGLTPVEAMAAGLPVLVTDWNGYRDTVRDGVDGFRIPTWQPRAGFGESIARKFEVKVNRYDLLISEMSTVVAVEMGALVERLTALVTDADLRRRMGAAGRDRARQIFDWSIVYKQYQALWDELNTMRIHARTEHAGLLAGAPGATPAGRDVFAAFSHYPTHSVGLETPVAATAEGSLARYRELITHPMWKLWPVQADLVDRIFTVLADGPTDIGKLAKATRVEPPAMVHITSRLTKMNLMVLGPAAAGGGD